MDYFSVKKYSKEDSKAFVLYRKEWFEKNIGWIFGIIVIIAVVWLIVKRVKKIREEVASL